MINSNAESPNEMPPVQKPKPEHTSITLICTLDESEKIEKISEMYRQGQWEKVGLRGYKENLKTIIDELNKIL